MGTAFAKWADTEMTDNGHAHPKKTEIA